MRALITGSHGFIGSHLTELLKSLKFDIYEVKRQDLEDCKILTALLEQAKPDYIFHLAAYGNHSTQNNITEILTANIIKTYHLLISSLKIPYTAFINFGSSSEYGVKDTMMNEDSFCDPATFYGATKLASTYLAKAFAIKFDKPIITVRPASVFGESEADFRFIPTICRSLIKNDTMFLDPMPRHSWIYIKDFVDALLIISGKIGQYKRGEIVNISYGEQWSNEEIVKKIENIVKKPVKTSNLTNIREFDNKSWLVGNQKLKNLNWQPSFGLDQGLERTYQYYKDRYGDKEQGLKKTDN